MSDDSGAVGPRVNPWSRLVLPAVLGGVALSVALVPADRHALLLNFTPSEPMGLYLRTGLAPASGRLVAFPAPPAAFPYADLHLAYLRTRPF